MAHFEARTSAVAGHMVVTLAGECDLSVREKLTDLLLEAVGGAEVVVVDLAGVTFMDSSGLHALMTARHAAQRGGRRLYVSGATGVVAALLELTGLQEVLRTPAAGTDPNAGPPDPAVEDSGHG